MKPLATLASLADSQCADMSPEAIDQRLRDLAQIYKLGMSLRGAQWLGPVNGEGPSFQSQCLSYNEEGGLQSRDREGAVDVQ